MFTTTRTLNRSLYGLTAGEVRQLLDGVADEQRLTVNVQRAGNDPRESDQISISVQVKN